MKVPAQILNANAVGISQVKLKHRRCTSWKYQFDLT